jgi:hypothetical protein
VVEYEILVQSINIERGTIGVTLLPPVSTGLPELNKNISVSPQKVSELNLLTDPDEILVFLRRVIISNDPVFQAEWNSIAVNKALELPVEVLGAIGQTFFAVTPEEIQELGLPVNENSYGDEVEI